MLNNVSKLFYSYCSRTCYRILPTKSHKSNFHLTLSYNYDFLDINKKNREVPRVLTIYDIDTPEDEARASIRAQFSKYSNIQDERVVDMLVEKGYMELEETLLQHKQRSHLLRNLSLNTEMKGSMRKRLMEDSTIEEQFARGY